MQYWWFAFKVDLHKPTLLAFERATNNTTELNSLQIIASKWVVGIGVLRKCSNLPKISAKNAHIFTPKS